VQHEISALTNTGEFSCGGAVRQDDAVHKKIWIDLDNSPHVPFFAPIIEELGRRGYSVFVTARDAYQVWELADFFQLRYTGVGRHYGKHRLFKVVGTCFRALQLLVLVRKIRPDLAVAHGSRSQTLASLLLRIPSVAMFDYEFINKSALLKATWLIGPEVVAKSIRFDGGRILSYPGIKEDVYVPLFKPDPSIQPVLGLNGDEVVVTLRPPATEAHYHNPASDRLFEAALEFLGQAPGVKVILLPRNVRQALAVRKSWPDLFKSRKVIIPEQTVDGLNLIWHSDLVISGGGTMNREAAALNVPVYSIFRGQIGAVDRHLAQEGRLVLLETIEDVQSKISLKRRERQITRSGIGGGTVLKCIVDQVVKVLESTPRVRGMNYDDAQHFSSR
jgi:predicted glycosyltransferase